MAIIAPFRGLRFNTEKIAHLEEVVTPPYDVIDEKAQARFVEKNPYNMVQLDLSKKVSTEESYANARALFQQWQDERILVRDTEPALYLYHIEYTHPSGTRLTRKGFVSLVQLAEFSEGIVKPHEKTFSEVTVGRAKLMDACKTNFSKIFSLYADQEGEIIRLLEDAKSGKPLCSVDDLDGNKHTIWEVTDFMVIDQVRGLLRDRALYIADGHHRYTTALNYRQLIRERQGELPSDSPFNHVMMYLCDMEDPGLSVLPTHRLLRLPGVRSADDCVKALKKGFTIEEISGGSREVLLAEVFARLDEEKQSGGMFGFYHPEEDRCFLMKIKDSVYRKAMKGLQPGPLLDLDVVMLSEFALEKMLGLSHETCERENLIDYYSDPDAALDGAVKEYTLNPAYTPMLFLMNETPVSQVKRVADENLVMPHKSTYFYPKILTGLVMNKLVEGESVF
ncbi:MAG: DUF1015 domain-containing protein [Proteobacteria bacterium]|nr:DUF1015 domain-containing protein [Pseudomonadota bacterium]MBU1708669.1 DUF1015 domain-containing protein [Pseudomonadota bacterium]